MVSEWVIACKELRDNWVTKSWSLKGGELGEAKYLWMYLAQWPVGIPVGIPVGAVVKKKKERTGLRDENSLCSTVAMSWPSPLGEQIRTGGKEAGQERTEGSNRRGVIWKHRTAVCGAWFGVISGTSYSEGLPSTQRAQTHTGEPPRYLS